MTMRSLNGMSSSVTATWRPSGLPRNSSSNGVETSPPALFGAEHFDYLLTIEGDQGPRDMVKGGRHVVTAPAELIDVDTPEELAELRALIHSPVAITRAVARRLD